MTTALEAAFLLAGFTAYAVGVIAIGVAVGLWMDRHQKRTVTFPKVGGGAIRTLDPITGVDEGETPAGYDPIGPMKVITKPEDIEPVAPKVGEAKAE